MWWLIFNLGISSHPNTTAVPPDFWSWVILMLWTRPNWIPSVYNATAHRESLRLQDAVIHHLQAAGIPDARMECPGYVAIGNGCGNRAFLHWYWRSRWEDGTGAAIGESDHLNAADVAAAILEILKK